MSAGNAYEGPMLKYVVAANGEVTRLDDNGGERVGSLKDGVLYMLPAKNNLRIETVQMLEAQGLKITQAILEGDTPDKPKTSEPPCPKMRRSQGDKTPEVVEWFKKYRPAEFRARYGVKGDEELDVPVLEKDFDTGVYKPIIDAVKDPETGKVTKTVRTERKVVTLASRKTHLTHRLENAEAAEYAD